MVDWKPIALQFITALITNSVIVGILGDLIKSSLLADRPHISFHTNMDSSYFTIAIRTTIANDGRAPATNLDLQFNYPGYLQRDTYAPKPTVADVVGASSITINATNESSFGSATPHLAVSVGSLLSGGKFTVIDQIRKSYLITSHFDSPCIVFAKYELEGTDQVRAQAYNEKHECTSTLFPLFDPMLIIASVTISLVLVIINMAPQKIKTFISKRNRAHFISNIIDDITQIYDSLREDIYSKIIFTSSAWNSQTANRKRKIFYNYDDYRKIDEFYSKVKKRDVYLQQKGTINDVVYEINKECLTLSETVMSNVNWITYYDNKHTVNIQSL